VWPPHPPFGHLLPQGRRGKPQRLRPFSPGGEGGPLGPDEEAARQNAHYHPPPPPPPPPPPDEPPPPENPEDELDGGGLGMVEAMVEAIEEEKPPMRSEKLPLLKLPEYQAGL